MIKITLNHARAAEEKKGPIRYLRPGHRHPETTLHHHAHPETLSASFGKKAAKLTQQIAGNLESMKGMGRQRGNCPWIRKL